MALLNLAIVCAVLTAASDAQICPRIMEDDLGNTTAPSTVGLIAARVGLGSQLPAVHLLQFSIVCEATAGTQNRSRHVSVVAEYRSADVLMLSQFEFSCVPSGASSEWSIMARGSTVDTFTTSPSANFSTPLRRDCYLCLSPARAATADPVNHCATCNSACVGLRQCTTQFPFSCCNYYNQEGNCVSTCPAPTVPQPDNSCGCSVGTMGSNCEISIDFCTDTSCMNSGTCASLNGSFQCTCPEDYTGEVCEIFIDPCERNPCSNGRMCMRESSSEFTCACPVGHSGGMCIDVNECESANLCRNGGTCQNTNGSYICVCQGSWEEPNCETCGIENCTQCSADGASCMLCAQGFIRNNESMCTLCTLDNCLQCAPNGVVCEVCSSGYVVENTGLCVRGLSRNSDLMNIQIIGIVVGCSFAIILLILVVCCCTFICKKTCKRWSSSYVHVDSKPIITPVLERHDIVKKTARKKTSLQQSSIVNAEAMAEGLEEEESLEVDETDVDIEITHV